MSERRIAGSVVAVGDCDGCGLPMVDDKSAVNPGAEPPEGTVFLGMAYATRGTPRCQLCEECFANALKWAAKAAHGVVQVGD